MAGQLDRRTVLTLGTGILGLPLVLRAYAFAATTGASGETSAPYSEPRDLYAALATQPHETIVIGGGIVEIVFADGAPGLDRNRTLDWIRTSAEAVTRYFGRYPVKKVGILVIAEDGAHIRGGTTYGFAGSVIRIHVGRSANAHVFAKDWIMVHEMTHLALPIVPQQSLWMLEGSATYVEPIARVQAGQLSAADAWRDSLNGMPKGQPMPGDRGLDNTPTWGRTYWGGALFCLLADIKIRQKTENRKGLQDAFRDINRVSGGNAAHWSMERLIAVGDGATGTQVLQDLYEAMKGTPVTVDLDALFETLGVNLVDGDVSFDDAAPLARIRTAILEPRQSSQRHTTSRSQTATTRSAS